MVRGDDVVRVRAEARSADPRARGQPLPSRIILPIGSHASSGRSESAGIEVRRVVCRGFLRIVIGRPSLGAEVGGRMPRTGAGAIQKFHDAILILRIVAQCNVSHSV